MKSIFLLLSILFTNTILCQNFKEEFNTNVEIINIEEINEFNYLRILKKGSIKFDQINSSSNVNIKTNNKIDLGRIVNHKIKHFSIPSYYVYDASNEIFVIDKYNFVDLNKFLGIKEKDFENKFQDEFIDTKILEQKGYQIFKRNYTKIKIAHLKMNKGFYNKYTIGVNVLGNYDDKIEVIYLIYHN